MDVAELIDDWLDREGGFVNQPAPLGGPTKFGVTEAVARAHGYAGPMRDLPRAEATVIATRLYWLRPRLDSVAVRAPRLAATLFAIGCAHGPAVAVTFLQRVLTAFNRSASDYADLVPDGRIGPLTLAALDRFLALRDPGGEQLLLTALGALRGERALRLAERRPPSEAPLYEWLAGKCGA